MKVFNNYFSEKKTQTHLE